MNRIELPPSLELRFATVLPTRWVDGDVQGVLNNAVYSTLLEEGRHAYFSALGLMRGGAFPFLLAQTNLCFRSPGYGGRRVLIELATVRLGQSSFDQVYRIREASGEEALPGGPVWCEAEARLVTYDPESGRSRAMEPEFRARLEAFEGLAPRE